MNHDPATPPVADRFEAIVPNPAGAQTRFAFDLEAPAAVAVAICDVAGRVVQRFDLGTLDAGRHEWEWNRRGALDAPMRTGYYYVRMTIGARRSLTRSLVLLQ